MLISSNTLTTRRWLQASWSLIFLGGSAGLAALIAGPGYRMDWWGLGEGIRVIAWSGIAAGSGVVLALLCAVFAYRKHGLAMAFRFLAGAFICCLTAAPAAFYGAKANNLPRIHDISTDLESPPEFVAMLALRKDAKNPARYDPKVAPLQRAGYPDISSIHLQKSPVAAFRLVNQVAQAMKWDIVATDPNTLRIEATATTLLFGFKDDVVIRVSPDGANSTVDIRSLSRIGVSDIGTNAGRIRDFRKRLEELARGG